MSPDEGQDEYEEVQAELRKKDEEVCDSPKEITISLIHCVQFKTSFLEIVVDKHLNPSSGAQTEICY